MKKLIIILVFISLTFTLNAQENWQFKLDKGIHAGTCAIIAVPSLLLMYNATNDWQLSKNASVMIPAIAALGKEFLDLFKWLATQQGAGFSFADFCYGVAGAYVSRFIMVGIYKWKQKRWNKKFNTSFVPDLRNKLLVKI